MPYQHTVLAQAHLASGRRHEELDAMDDAFRFSTDALWWLPKQHWVHAELLLLEPTDEAEATAAFHRALDVARTHGNRAAELRAATRLARLLHRQERAAEARDLLAEPYDSFTEGFALPDLREAKELLEELKSTLSS